MRLQIMIAIALRFSIYCFHWMVLAYLPCCWRPAFFVLALYFGVEQTSLTLLLRDGLGFSMERIGLVFAGLGVWMALMVPIVGRFHDRRQSVFFFFLGGLAVSGFFQVLTGLVAGFGVLVALLFPSQRLGAVPACSTGCVPSAPSWRPWLVAW